MGCTKKECHGAVVCKWQIKTSSSWSNAQCVCTWLNKHCILVAVMSTPATHSQHYYKTTTASRHSHRQLRHGNRKLHFPGFLAKRGRHIPVLTVPGVLKKKEEGFISHLCFYSAGKLFSLHIPASHSTAPLKYRGLRALLKAAWHCWSLIPWTSGQWSSTLTAEPPKVVS